MVRMVAQEVQFTWTLCTVKLTHNFSAVHNGIDPMTVTNYDAGIGTLISGYQLHYAEVLLEELDPSDMFTSYANFTLMNLVC